MKMWVELWVGLFRGLPANPKKRMVGTRRLELLTSTVSIQPVIRFYNDLQIRGGCLSTRKSYKTSHFVGWVVGWRDLAEQTPCPPNRSCVRPAESERHDTGPSWHHAITTLRNRDTRLA